MKQIYVCFFSALLGGLLLGNAAELGAQQAKSVDVSIHMLTTENGSGLGEKIGTLTITETPEGLLFKPAITGLPAGEHGFHLHENPILGPKDVKGKLTAGLQAGNHYDPAKTGKHFGPYNPKGHLGDLPVLYVDETGNTPFAVLAPRIKTLNEISDRSVMIHIMGDNYSDTPVTLGGGGGRMAGGIIGK